jgi:uncharacterized RDD family membrane protein YckC
MTDPNEPRGQGPSFEKRPDPPQQFPPQFPPAPPAPPGPPYQPGSWPGHLGQPPGVEMASIGRRIGAYFLAIPLFIVTLGIGYVIWGLILWGRGTSPALKVLGMKCWLVNDQRVPGFWRMVLRDLVGNFVEGLFILPIVGFIMFLATEKRQSLHDTIGGTTVVYDPRKVLG